MASRHPKGLYVLFFTEMWERFGFYLLGALFVQYLTLHLKMSKAEATHIQGLYLMSVYLTPFVGGVFADRVYGYTRAVLTGAALLAAGYLLFAIQNKLAFYASLGLLVLGNGLFKPNISTLVGNLYPQGDARRDSAFSIFYMGINIGALFSGPVGETMRTYFGWPVAFATAGIGMVLSMLIFAAFRRMVTVADRRSSIGALLDVELPAEYEDRDPPEVERARIAALAIMCFIVMFFWMAFHQNVSTLTFWALENTNRVLSVGSWTWEIPPGWFQAANSLFIIILTPILVRIFGTLRKRNLEPSTPAKIGLGMVFTALSYALMVIASLAGGNTGRVSMWWLIGCYFIITIAELFLSPMGLSMVTKLAPRRMTAMLMGIWFIATSAGNYLSGFLGRFWEPWPHSKFFSLLVITSLAAAGLLATQYRRLKAAMPPEGPPESESSQPPPAATSEEVVTAAPA